YLRWIKDGNRPFLNKGKGRSLIFSGFLVTHPSSPFFTLLNLNESKQLKRIHRFWKVIISIILKEMHWYNNSSQDLDFFLGLLNNSDSNKILNII
ncbi:hypothetical protein BpHYR1_011015, partial [Brachionus plicatilis]